MHTMTVKTISRKIEIGLLRGMQTDRVHNMHLSVTSQLYLFEVAVNFVHS